MTVQSRLSEKERRAPSGGVKATTQLRDIGVKSDAAAKPAAVAPELQPLISDVRHLPADSSVIIVFLYSSDYIGANGKCTTYTTEQYHLIFLSTKELTPEATTINCKIIPSIMTYESIYFCTHCKYLEQLA